MPSNCVRGYSWSICAFLFILVIWTADLVLCAYCAPCTSFWQKLARCQLPLHGRLHRSTFACGTQVMVSRPRHNSTGKPQV
ncbi:uncharacterized protein HD556DRAFT_1485628, partial [Suillus plorans]